MYIRYLLLILLNFFCCNASIEEGVLRTHLFQNYNNKIRPVKNDSQPLLINMGSHLNMIIIDNLEKTFERFEPNKHGAESIHGKLIFTMLDNKLEKILPKYKYYPPSKFSPFELIFQDIEESNLKKGIKIPIQMIDAEGYCAAWCIWYTEMRLKFPQLI
jgi:hypothetical protein